MKVLVIGASGMLAKPVIQQFDKAGFQPVLFSRTVNQAMFDKSYAMVQGDVFKPNDLNRAMEGCEAVHISLSTANDALAVKLIIESATKNGIRLISYISGCTVAEENRWFSMINNKYQAEQAIIRSGTPYLIFRPTWFFESLNLMVRDGKAMILGKQPHPSHWVAAADYARMVSTAYSKPEAKNRVFFVFGPEQFDMKDLLVNYCKHRYPEIRKVSSIPLGMIKIIALLTGNKELKMAASIFSYFEKVKEMGNPDEANSLLGKPEITFKKWIIAIA